MLEIGVQLYSLRREMEADLAAAVCGVRELGCDGVELARTEGLDARGWRDLLETADLKPLGAHVRLEELEQEWDAKVDFQRVIGNGTIVVPAPQPGWETADESDYRDTARRLNVLGKRAQSEGFRFAYHNHYWEFAPFDGSEGGLCGMDVLLEDTDPGLVGWEIDTAWATKGGWDPVELLREQKGRILMVHAKEYRGADDSEPPMGEGDVDFPIIVDLAKRHGWPLVIEYEGEPAPAGVAQSARYLRSLLD